jgi:type II secretory pathway pseudopilin PulG
MQEDLPRQRGAIAILALLLLIAAVGCVVALQLLLPATEAARRRATERAMARAREALIAYAADRPIDPIVGPGYLPCPDIDDDGWAEATCGSLSGDSGQAQRLGRLPWKTLGLADLREAGGEPLWYAVSTKYKGLLNCTASPACVDMSPDAALGTITVRDASGPLLHDGTIADAARANQGGAVALVIAPASRAPSGDNAGFVDRSDAAGRPRNADGFTLGAGDGIAALGYGDVMPRVMRRVALEVAACLRAHALATGSYPAPAPLCAQASDPDAWSSVPGAGFGRVPDAAWPPACNLAPSASHSWWRAWRANVFYALRPGALEVADLDGRVLARARDAAVIVAGPPATRDGFTQHRDAASFGDARQWLEAGNAALDDGAGCGAPAVHGCAAAGTCNRITIAAPQRAFNDVAVTLP